ncbi:putative linoleate 9S-lipoxygenase 4 [Ananas comosus]|uniref:Lipoxygenase n=1 Tax=Ananas comosus TaxID=4615 RepID=A0A199VEZ9_ANACO|nr:putative linoleate 9S-lipoxygenase 4 [Ananas comosus]
MRRNVLDFCDFTASLLDGLHEFLGSGVSFQLGKVGKPAFLEEWVTTLTSISAGESKFKVTFDWDDSQGIPGAVIVKNNHHSEFYLKTLTIEGVPGRGRIHFVCNSWVYPADKHKQDRVFFTNDTYLPSKMPEPLRPYRQQELLNLRGANVAPGPLKEHDRVYNYDVYNDLGDPDKGANHMRPILGGSREHPYPRRCRTGRHPTKTDPKSESRLPQLSLDIYVPRDEKFGHLKMSDFLGYALKSVTQAILPTLHTIFDMTPMEFDSFQDILNLYEGGIKLPNSPELEEVRKQIPFEMIKELFRSDGEHFLKLPLPQVIKEDKFAWRTDEEFAREMLAGVNPVVIRRLQEFPPASKLDPKVYGNQTSAITAAHIEKNLEGLKVDQIDLFDYKPPHNANGFSEICNNNLLQALRSNRLFILDHHDAFMPYLNRINSLGHMCIYATRTLLFLKSDGTLKPLAIELSLPHPDGDQHGAVSKVYTPADRGVEGSVWQLAKAYAAVNDSGYHQLISHWLNTHAVIEPFAIATNRQLSVTHPVHKLLSPHYRDTMNINALARQTLINAGGIFETTVFPGKYALEMSSVAYKNWNLTEQALPDDLVKRGMAVEDPSSPYKVRLVIKDYPYAADGLAIWWAIDAWVNEYCSLYYPTDAAVQADAELQGWWTEVREAGHGDLKDETWWPKMQTLKELTKTCTTIIWVASALHAAVNFGQYPYAGYLPNRPTVSRRPMPEPGTPEYAELAKDPEKAFIRTITSQFQTILGISLIEVLSRHSSDEVYLGQRDTPEWTAEQRALDAFKRFGDRLVAIENRIAQMNADPSLKNRNGPVKMPYMLLYPNTSDVTGVGGLTGKGIPNSISI